LRGADAARDKLNPNTVDHVEGSVSLAFVKLPESQ
jgi:hypothetical protein